MHCVGSRGLTGKALFAAGLAVLLAACSGADEPVAASEQLETELPDWPLDGAVTLDRLPTPTDPQLIAGASVWDGTCRGCHGLGIADSPKVTDRTAWAPRIEQGVEILYQHALEGHFGPRGTMMPPRGGNDQLSDDEVKSAVDFMIANSQ